MTKATPLVITRADLADFLAETGALSKKTAFAALGDLIDLIARHLQADCTIHLKGLGRFEVVATTERPGRNPRTGEAMTIPAGRRVKFKPSKHLLKEAP